MQKVVIQHSSCLCTCVGLAEADEPSWPLLLAPLAAESAPSLSSSLPEDADVAAGTSLIENMLRS